MLKPWIICFLSACFYCYTYLLRISPNVMAQELIYSFNISASVFGYLIAFYYYAYTPLQLPVGLFLDKYGSKRMLTFAVFSCILGTFLFGYATRLWVAELGRFLVGLGSAFAFIGVLKLSSTWLPTTHFATTTGIIITLGTFGTMLGNLLIGKTVQLYNWQTTQQMLAYLGILFIPIIWFFIADTPSLSKKQLSFRLLFNNTLHLIKKPQIWINSLIGCLLFLPSSVFCELWGYSCLIALHQIDREQATAAISLTFLGWAIGAPIVGLLSKNYKMRKLLLQFACFMTTVLFCWIVYGPRQSYFVLYVLLFLFGLFSSPQILILTIAKEMSPPELTGICFAFTNFIVMMGTLIFQPTIGILLDFHEPLPLQQTLSIYTAHNYLFALWILPLGLIIAFCLTAFLKETHKPLPKHQ